MNYLESVIKQFEYYKMLGEKTFAQLPEEKLFWQYNEDSNSIATIVKHLWGNMLSRWTDFLNSDGEKEWRDRDAEFENDISSAQELHHKWNEGWEVFMSALQSLREEDLDRIVYIRNQGHTVQEAINRQLAHYPYHIGQIVFIGKMAANSWESLSIPRGNSKQFNADKFAKPKTIGHFTDDFLKKHLTIEEIKARLWSSHQGLWDYCRTIPVAEQDKRVAGKWSPLQHIQHITKGSGAVWKYLEMEKTQIEQTFGIADHSSRTYDEVYNAYLKRLGEGAKSTERFNPDEGSPITLEAEEATGRHIIESMNHALDSWTDADLEKYICPHPNLGNMTAREILYFTIIHAIHHTESIRKIA